MIDAMLERLVIIKTQINPGLLRQYPFSSGDILAGSGGEFSDDFF